MLVLTRKLNQSIMIGDIEVVVAEVCGDQVRLGSVEMRFESDAHKTSQPLPPTQTGIDMSQVGTGSAPPPSFGAGSAFGRKKQTKRSPMIWALLGLSSRGF